MGTIDSVLVRWENQVNWHLTPSIRHGAAACGKSVPITEAALEYAEIDVLQISSFKGICKKCFHEMCIDLQNQAMWDIYYEHIAEKI